MALTRRAAWATVALCVLVQLLAPHRSLAQGDHRLVWRTLSTEHFEIHYHEPLGLLARHFASQAEAIHGRVAGALGLSLRQRVQVVLSDDDDAANGSATPLPYNVIRLRAVAPDDMSALADFDDWPTLLLTHEHTHIVHLEQATGLPRLYQAIFGRSYGPQQFLPGWFIEGLATISESAHTSAGRVRGSLFDMYLRMDALEDRILGLDLMSFDGEPWPHGNVRYLYGQAFLHFIAERYGMRAFGRFAEEYGRRIVPYGINRAMKRATGKNFIELYEEFKVDLVARAEATRARVADRGLHEGSRITFHGETTRAPRYLPGGDIAYMVSDERHPPELRVVSGVPDAPARRVTRVPNTGNVSVVPGADRLIYSANAFHRGVYNFSELYEVDGSGGRPRKITDGLRAREPDISPDGRFVAYVTHGAGTSHLILAELGPDLESRASVRAAIAGTRRMLVRSRELEQVYTPRFSPDGKYVAYGAQSHGGYRDIWLVEVATGMRTRLTYDRALDRGPVFSRDGRTLYFSSDRTGIANLYALDLASGALTQLTNVVGGAYQPDVSPDGTTLVYVGYTSKGFDLYTLRLADAAQFPAEPSFERPAPLVPAPPLAQASRAYSPAFTLLPRSWSFSVDDGGNGQQLTLSTDGRDAVGFHGWSLQLIENLEHKDHQLELGYSYRRPRFPINMRFNFRDYERTNLVVNNRYQDWDSRSWGLLLGSRFSFPWALHSFSIRPDYQLTFGEKTKPYDLHAIDPNYPPPELPYTGVDARLSANVELATVQRQAYDISQSWGYVLDVSASVRHPYIASRERDRSFSWRYEHFFRFDFRESVIAMAYNGAWDTAVAVGGTPAQVGPIFDYVAGTRGSPTDYARLRGFPRQEGDRLGLLQLEYRALVMRINRGLDTLPIFARRIHAALFSDMGNVWTGKKDWSEFDIGIGAELRLDWSSDYGNPLTLRLGIAQGLTEGGELQWYASMTRVY